MNYREYIRAFTSQPRWAHAPTLLLYVIALYLYYTTAMTSIKEFTNQEVYQTFKQDNNLITSLVSESLTQDEALDRLTLLGFTIIDGQRLLNKKLGSHYIRALTRRALGETEKTIDELYWEERKRDAT